MRSADAAAAAITKTQKPKQKGARTFMKIESIAENSLLYDFYGQLLSKRQQEVMALYHEENLSLSEIAEEFGISRQAVHDTLKKAEQALNEYEAKLGLMARLMKSKDAVADIDARIDRLISELTRGREAQGAESSVQQGLKSQGAADNAEIVSKLKEIKTIINELE